MDIIDLKMDIIDHLKSSPNTYLSLGLQLCFERQFIPFNTIPAVTFSFLALRQRHSIHHAAACGTVKLRKNTQ